MSNTTPRFLADADGFVSWPRIKHGKLIKIFIAEVWSQAFLCVCVRGEGGDTMMRDKSQSQIINNNGDN